MRFCNLADTTFCQLLKLNKDKLHFNQIDKKVTKGSSVPF